MPISIRLPAAIEKEISGFSERQGISKSAVIVRSIQEYLANHAQPTSQQLYDEAMRSASESEARNTQTANTEPRAHKIKVRAAIKRKHAKRSTQPE